MAVNWGDLIKTLGQGAAVGPLAKALQGIGMNTEESSTLAKEIVMGKKPIPAQLAPPLTTPIAIPWTPIIAGGLALLAVFWLIRR